MVPLSGIPPSPGLPPSLKLWRTGWRTRNPDLQLPHNSVKLTHYRLNGAMGRSLLPALDERMPGLPRGSKNKKAPEPCGSGAKLGGGSSPRSLPVRTHLALSLSRAVCSPTPLFAACEGFSLMAGPSRPLPAGIYRVRPLRPVRPPLASGSHAGRGADTPATYVARVGTVTTGSAPAFGRALAPCYGSDLLTLRLHFALQLGDVVFRAAPRKEVFRALPGPVFPRNFVPFTRPVPCESGPFWRGGLARTRCFALVCAVATVSLWGNCVGGRIETPRTPHSARARFLIAPCRTAPKSYH